MPTHQNKRLVRRCIEEVVNAGEVGPAAGPRIAPTAQLDPELL